MNSRQRLIQASLMAAIMLATVLPVWNSVTSAQTESKDEWSRWRGPTGNGIAAADQKPPTEWSSNKNVVWKVEVPGRGHASPVIVGDKIFLATSDKGDGTQSVACYDRKSGDPKWMTECNKGGLARRIHPNNTHASSTIATDGEHVFAVFSHHGQIEAFALDYDGKIAWKKTVGNYKPKYPFGYGASPIVYDDVVLVSNENQDNGGISALSKKDGSVKWKIDRNGLSSYSTPVITELDGKDQLLISGGNAVRSYDPKNGKELWSADAKWIVTCGMMVWDGDLVFASGGYPTQQTLAVNYKTGEVVWQNAEKAYEQSMLAHDGYLYFHNEVGALTCYRCSDGKQMWKQRFARGVSASPTLVNGNIYFPAENGKTMIVKANPEKFEKVATNQLGDATFATPAFCGQQMFIRVAEEGQEYLYCIGKNE